MGKINGKPRRFVSVKELARHLNVPESALMAMLAEDSYRLARFGDELLITESDAVKVCVNLNNNGSNVHSVLIHLREASRRFHLALGIIQNLIETGFLKEVKKANNKTYIWEDDLARLIAVATFLNIAPTCRAFKAV